MRYYFSYKALISQAHLTQPPIHISQLYNCSYLYSVNLHCADRSSFILRNIIIQNTVLMCNTLWFTDISCEIAFTTSPQIHHILYIITCREKEENNVIIDLISSFDQLLLISKHAFW